MSALTYGALGTVAAITAVSGDHTPDGSVLETTSHWMLGSTAGRTALASGAAIVVLVGLFFLYKGLSGRFMTHIDTQRAPEWRRRFMRWTGAFGWSGRSLLVIAPAVFAFLAAIQADHADVNGLDSALHELADSRAGRIYVVVTSALIMSYAAFCLISLRYRTPDAHGRDG